MRFGGLVMQFGDLKKELQHKERSIGDLISYLKTRTGGCPNYSILLGAGASVTSGIESGEQLVTQWRKEIYELLSKKEYTTIQDAKNYLMTKEGSWYSEQNEYSSLFEKKFDLATQRRRFVENQVDSATPSIGYAYLSSLCEPSDRFIDTIFTTNFDDLVNEAFYQFSLTRPIVCAHDSSVRSITITSTRPKIIKLHGDYLFDDIKSTLRETESLEENIKNKLIEFSKEYGLIVIGYAGNDRSIMDVLNHLLKSEEYLKNGIYWCIRKNSYISPELRKLLWKDRVYFVEIDGFDQALAEIHHEIKGALPFKDSFVDSKKDLILESFSEDKYELSEESRYIKDDLNSLKRHKNERDISNLIRELSNTMDDAGSVDISESLFKSLLKIDTLINSQQYDQAKMLAESNLLSAESEQMKIRFIRKLIYITKNMGNFAETQRYADSLIEIDEYESEYFLIKADSFNNIKDCCEFLKENVTKFKDSSNYLNFLVSRGLTEFKSSTSATFSYDELIKYVEDSLRVYPSLDNQAWDLRLRVIKTKFPDFKTLKDNDRERMMAECDAVIESAREINPKHIAYICLKAQHPKYSLEYTETKKLAEECEALFGTSKKSKKRELTRQIMNCYWYIKNNREDDKEVFNNDLLELFNKDIIEGYEYKNKSVSYHLLKAYYSLTVDRNLQSHQKHLDKATKCSDAIARCSTIINLQLFVHNDIEGAMSFAKSIREDLKEDIYYDLLHQIELFKKDYKKSLEYLELAKDKGLEYGDYVNNKSFIYLKQERYQEVINWCEKNKNNRLDYYSRNVCIVNREAAKKLSNQKIDETSLRNIIGQRPSNRVKLACQILLGDKLAAERLLDKVLRIDFAEYYAIGFWPLMDMTLLEKYNDYLSKPNVVKAA